MTIESWRNAPSSGAPGNHIVKEKNEIVFCAFREKGNLLLYDLLLPCIFESFDVVCFLCMLLPTLSRLELMKSAMPCRLRISTPFSSTSAGNSPWSSLKSFLYCHSALGAAFYLSGILRHANKAQVWKVLAAYIINVVWYVNDDFFVLCNMRSAEQSFFTRNTVGVGISRTFRKYFL